MTILTGAATARIYFFLSWLARMLLGPLMAHWVLVGVAVLLELPLSEMTGITAIATGFVVVGALVVLTVYREHPAVRERLEHGPKIDPRWSAVILALGALSHVGGMALSRAGHSSSAHWAMALGTAVVVCEVTSLAGGAILNSLKPVDDEE